MKKAHLKPFICLLALFFLDMSIPINLFFNADFTMVGIIFLSFYLDPRIIFLYSLLFGMAKDAMSHNTIPLYTFDFTIVALLVKIMLKYFGEKILSRLIIAFIAVIFGLAFNSISERGFSFIFSLKFILSSFAVLLFIDYTLSGWIQR